MKLMTFIFGCIIGWCLFPIIFSESSTNVTNIDCIDPNGLIFEHIWLDGALFWQYNQYRNTIRKKDYLSKGVESYYHCDRCGKVKINHQNGDIDIFMPVQGAVA